MFLLVSQSLEAHHSPPLLPRHMGRASAKHAPQGPRAVAHDVRLTGLDEEGDRTNEEMEKGRGKIVSVRYYQVTL